MPGAPSRPPRGADPRPLCPFPLRPYHRAAIKGVGCHLSLFSPFPLISARAPCLLPHFLPLDAPVHRRRLRGFGPCQILPELHRHPPSSVSASRSFDLLQPTAPYSLPSSSKLQGHATTVGDHHATSPAAERHCPEASPPPPHRIVARISTTSKFLARQIRCLAVVI
jgi:hypothetical protein